MFYFSRIYLGFIILTKISGFQRFIERSPSYYLILFITIEIEDGFGPTKQYLSFVVSPTIPNVDRQELSTPTLPQIAKFRIYKMLRHVKMRLANDVVLVLIYLKVS